MGKPFSIWARLNISKAFILWSKCEWLNSACIELSNCSFLPLDDYSVRPTGTSYKSLANPSSCAVHKKHPDVLGFGGSRYPSIRVSAPDMTQLSYTYVYAVLSSSPMTLVRVPGQNSTGCGRFYQSEHYESVTMGFPESDMTPVSCQRIKMKENHTE